MPAALDPIQFQYRDSYFIQAKDAQGKDQYYRIYAFEIDKDGNKKEISLTLLQWQQTAQELQLNLKQFLGSPIAVPEKFTVTVTPDDHLELTPKGQATQRLREGDPTLKRTCDLFRAVIYGDAGNPLPVRYSEELLQVPDLPENLANTLPVPDPLKPPVVGIHNEGNDCFISAYLQAFVLDDRELMEAIWEERENGKITALALFLYRYLEAQRTGQPVQGVHQVRNALVRMLGSKIKLRSGQHDPTKAFSFFHDPSKLSEGLKAAMHFQKQWAKDYWEIPGPQSENEKLELLRNENPDLTFHSDQYGIYTETPPLNLDFVGYGPINYKQGKSLNDLILESLETDSPQDATQNGAYILGNRVAVCATAPNHLTIPIINLDRKSLDAVEPTLRVPGNHFTHGREETYELTSFIQHLGTSNKSGHYTAYVKQGGKYYACDDNSVAEILEPKFLEAAKNAYVVRYTHS